MSIFAAAFDKIPGVVRDPDCGKSPTRREQDLNLRRIWVQTLLNEVVQ